jgi:CubicO group peptidase (beta-lactamase class C family)
MKPVQSLRLGYIMVALAAGLLIVTPRAQAGEGRCSEIPPSQLKQQIGQLLQGLLSSVNPPQGTHIGFAISVVQPLCNSNRYEANLFFYGDLLAADGKTPLQFDRDTEFHLGSTGKTFTGNLLAQLTFNQRDLLDNPVSNYISNAPTYNGQQILVRDLADYTSGLPSTPNPIDYSSKACWNGIFPALSPGCWPADTSVEQFKAQALMFVPGSKYFYSNWALGILSLVEAQLAGGTATANDQQYDTLLQEWWPLINQMVLNPIGMHHSHIFIPFIDNPQLPTSYSNPAHGTVNTRFQSDYPADLGTAGVILTPGDFQTYLLYMMGLIQRPTSYVVPYMLTPLTSVTSANGAKLDMTWFNPPFGSKSFSYFYKNGAGPGFESYIAFIPQTKTGVAALINANGITPGKIGFPTLQIINGVKPDDSKENTDDPG